MTRARITVAAIAAATAAGGATAALAGTTAAPTVVHASLTEFAIKPSTVRVRHGRIRFVVKNAGAATHELVIVRTTKPAYGLGGPNGAAESGKVGEVSDLAAGQTRKLTVRLAPGHYVLMCNLPGHYKEGMYANLKVT